MKRHDLPKPGVPRKRRIAGHAQDDHVIDTYKLREKLPDSTRCPMCGATYREGRWHWPSAALPAPAHEELCSACHRVRDKYPAGILRLKGMLVGTHRSEVLGLVKNTEEAERKEHCQNRVMAIEEPASDELVITTTDIHLPRRIGEAMRRAFHGDLNLHYDKESYFVRAEWLGAAQDGVGESSRR
jgi:hypothetical protein